MSEYRILVYGDIHLSSKNYGMHRDYPNESLALLKHITETAIEVRATHIIGLGDFSYGRFHSLEYRMEVENELKRQNMITNGNRYELKGNHDKASYGMTEYEYYLIQGLLKSTEHLSFDKASISLLDYGKDKVTIEENKQNIVLMHDYYKFNDSNLPVYGEPKILDTKTEWKGVDFIFGGHIHDTIKLNGVIADSGKTTGLVYLGCPCRPSYSDKLQDKGYYGLISLSDDKVNIEIIDFDLPSISETFNLDEIEKERVERKRVNVDDITESLNSHSRLTGEPIDKVNALTNVKEEYKQKAIDLLMMANN